MHSRLSTARHSARPAVGHLAAQLHAPLTSTQSRGREHEARQHFRVRVVSSVRTILAVLVRRVGGSAGEVLQRRRTDTARSSKSGAQLELDDVSPIGCEGERVVSA